LSVIFHLSPSPFLFTLAKPLGKTQGLASFAPLWRKFFSVLQATNTKQVALTGVVVVHELEVVTHTPAVGDVAIVLTGTPPVAEVADIDERAIGTAVAARQGGKP